MFFDEITNHLNTTMDLETIDITPNLEVKKSEEDKDIQDDYEYSRSLLREMLDKGRNTLDNLESLSGIADDPKLYDSFSNLLRNMADTTEKLMDLQKKKKNLTGDKEEENTPKNVTNNNVIFGGTAKDLLAELKRQKKDNIDV